MNALKPNCVSVRKRVWIVIMGGGAEHFLRGNCGNRDITKSLFASLPGWWRGGGQLFLAIDQTQVIAMMTISDWLEGAH